jgi:uncharacterized membrane protein YfcA
MDILHILAGAVVGFTIGITGVGGGSLMTPILVLGFSINPAIAVGTDLLYAAITKCGGIAAHHRQQTIDWAIVKRLAMGSIPASIITIFFLDQLRDSGFDYEKLMTTTLSIMLILTSVVIIMHKRLMTFLHSSLSEKAHWRQWLINFRPMATTITGAILGVLVTISSVGAGAIGAAVLFFLYPRRAAINIIGTDIAHAVPLTAIAGLGHFHFGSVDLELLGGLLIGSLPAIYIGSHLGKKLPERFLRPIVATILIAMGIRFAF